MSQLVTALKHPVGWLRQRMANWALKRQGTDPDPVTLKSRRTYIIPTALGIGYGLVLFAMLMASMNYNNSMGFALTFTLAGLGIVAMHWCHQNLTGLTVRGIRVDPAFAGEQATLSLCLENASNSERYELVVACGANVIPTVDLAPGESTEVAIRIPTHRRGVYFIERIGVSTRFPFGLFRSWSWLHPAVSGVVYPAPAPRNEAPPPDNTDTGGAQDDRKGEDDFAGLRNFHRGDSPRHIAWKAMAKGGELLVKQFAGTDVTTHWLDWEKAQEQETEEKLSRLCRWVVDAHAHGQAYGLRIPGSEFPPAIGHSHRHHCLMALAVFGQDGVKGE